MQVSDLARMVSEMRRAQREYFRTRTPAALERAKAAEAKVDQAVAEALDRQTTMFGGSDEQ